MSERHELRYVPDLAIGVVEVIGVEVAAVKQPTAACTQVIVPAKAVDGHYVTLKIWAWVKALTFPLVAGCTTPQSDRHTIFLPPAELLELLVGCATPSLRELAMQVSILLPAL